MGAVMRNGMQRRLTSWAPVRVYLRDWTFFRRMWWSVMLGSIIQPLLFLLGVGLGIGELVDNGPAAANVLGDTSYFAFYATALFATSAMFVLSQEAMWGTLDGFQWSSAHVAMISTPLTPTDVAIGKALHYAMRALFTGVGVALVLALFDDTRRVGLLLAPFGSVLTGLAFGLPIAAWTGSRTTDASFPAILRFGVIPMFLFGGAFYPITQLPGWLQSVAWITPLWHGVELCRAMVLGGTSPAQMAMHLGVLLAFCSLGLFAMTKTFAARLRA